MMTPNLALPLLATAQLEKELTHNEALVIIDALLFQTVIDGPQNTPPVEPVAGQSWIVGSDPEDDWDGAERSLAIWTEGGWRFVLPTEKMKICRKTDGTILSFDGSEWRLPQTILEAIGGLTVDVEARAMLSELLELLQEHGLVKTT